MRPSNELLVRVRHRVLNEQIAVRYESLLVDAQTRGFVAFQIESTRVSHDPGLALGIVSAQFQIERELVECRKFAGLFREWIGIGAPRGGSWHNLGVRKYDAPRALLRNRVDPKLKVVAALPLKQCRITPRPRHPNNFLLDLRAQLRCRLHDTAAPNGRGAFAIRKGSLHQLAVDLKR